MPTYLTQFYASLLSFTYNENSKDHLVMLAVAPTEAEVGKIGSDLHRIQVNHFMNHKCFNSTHGITNDGSNKETVGKHVYNPFVLADE